MKKFGRSKSDMSQTLSQSRQRIETSARSRSQTVAMIEEPAAEQAQVSEFTEVSEDTETQKGTEEDGEFSEVTEEEETGTEKETETEQGTEEEGIDPAIMIARLTAFDNSEKLKEMSNLKKIGIVHGAKLKSRYKAENYEVDPQEQIEHRLNVWKQEPDFPPRFHLLSLKEIKNPDRFMAETDSETEEAQEKRESDVAFRERKIRKYKKKFRLAYNGVIAAVGVLFLCVGMGLRHLRKLPGKLAKYKKPVVILNKIGLPLLGIAALLFFISVVGVLGALGNVNLFRKIYMIFVDHKKTVMKVLLLSLTISMVLCGLGVTGYGMYARSSRKRFAESLSEKNNSENHPIFMLLLTAPGLLCVGSIGFIVMGGAGTAVTFLPKSLPLSIYVLIMIPWVCIQGILFTSFLFTPTKKGEYYIRQYLIKTYRGGSGYQHGTFKPTSNLPSFFLDTFQYVVACCGAEGPHDFQHSKLWNHKVHYMTGGGPKVTRAFLPLSCCRIKDTIRHGRPTIMIFENAEQCLTAPTNKTAHFNGCFKAAKKKMWKCLPVVSVVLVLQFIAIGAAKSLHQVMQKEETQSKNKKEQGEDPEKAETENPEVTEMHKPEKSETEKSEVAKTKQSKVDTMGKSEETETEKSEVADTEESEVAKTEESVTEESVTEESVTEESEVVETESMKKLKQKQ